MHGHAPSHASDALDGAHDDIVGMTLQMQVKALRV